MSYLKWIGVFSLGVFVGMIATGYILQRQLSYLTVSKQVDAAFLAAQQAEWLALLRLGETEDAIENLEQSMGIGVTGIAQWAAAEPPRESDANSRDAFLTNVKVYYDSYPASRPDQTVALNLLAQVPSRHSQGKCKAGICRLDDRRLAATKKATAAP